MLHRLADIGRNRYVLAIVTGGLAGGTLLLFFLLVRGQRDTIILQVQPVSDPLAVQVYVGGEVGSPGLYTLRRGSRVADAVTLAGGLLPGADIAIIGMASVLEDSDQIIVPPRRPTPLPVTQASPVATSPSVAAKMTNLPELSTPAPPGAGASGPVNINTATVEEMDPLPGIGRVIAGRIIEYRLANGPFQALEELEQVEGISLRMVEEMRPLITLGS